MHVFHSNKKIKSKNVLSCISLNAKNFMKNFIFMHVFQFVQKIKYKMFLSSMSVTSSNKKITNVFLFIFFTISEKKKHHVFFIKCSFHACTH